jgi:hypothetical protein
VILSACLIEWHEFLGSPNLTPKRNFKNLIDITRREYSDFFLYEERGFQNIEAHTRMFHIDLGCTFLNANIAQIVQGKSRLPHNPLSKKPASRLFYCGILSA